MGIGSMDTAFDTQLLQLLAHCYGARMEAFKFFSYLLCLLNLIVERVTLRIKPQL
jgi:hypothetical protein